MKTKTEFLLTELNARRGLAYPDVGYCFFADIAGNGGPRKRRVWTIVNESGGVTRSGLNGPNPRATVLKILRALSKEPPA